MEYIIKETREEYHLTQKEFSDVLSIPLRTIENWETGKRKPTPWVEKLIVSYFKNLPQNQQGIITETLGVYEINQIKDIVRRICVNYDIDRVILFGSYSTNTQDQTSDIDLLVEGTIKGLSFFGLLDELSNSFVKKIELIHSSEVNKKSKTYENMMNGIILYER